MTGSEMIGNRNMGDTVDFFKTDFYEDEKAPKTFCCTNGGIGLKGVSWTIDDSDPNSQRCRSIGALEDQLDDFELSSLLMKAKSLESVAGSSTDGSPFDYPSVLDQDACGGVPTAPPYARQSLLRDLAQTQLALWTFTLSIAGTYWWQRRAHLKALLIALFLFNASALFSVFLVFAVVMAHVFRRDWTSQMFGDGKGSFYATSKMTRGDSRRQSLRSQSSWMSFYNNNRCLSGDGSAGVDVAALDPFCGNYASTTDGTATTSASQHSGRSTPRSRTSAVSGRANSCCSATRVWQQKVQIGSICYGRCLRT